MLNQDKVLNIINSELITDLCSEDYLLDFSKNPDVLLVQVPIYLRPNEEIKNIRLIDIDSHQQLHSASAEELHRINDLSIINKSKRLNSPLSVTRPCIICSFCNKSFSHLGDHNKHVRRHTGERPYGCELCSQRFAYSSNLTRHRRAVHSGEKPFECNICSRKFSRRDKLSDHAARRCCGCEDES